MPPRSSALQNNPGKYLFILRGAADIDNLAPVIWACGRASQPMLLLTSSSQADQLVRSAWWWVDLTHATVVAFTADDSRHPITRRLRRIRHHRAAMRRFLRHNSVRLVAVEWGELPQRRGTSLLRRVWRWCSNDVVSQVKHAAQDLGIPIVALPHGHSTKTVVIRSRHVEEVMAKHGGRLPFADRDGFAAYVFASRYHRDAILASSTMSGRNIEVWGSPRFNDVWVPRLYAQAPLWSLPQTGVGRRVVLFFVPKWNNLIDRVETLRLMIAIAEQPGLHLVVRGHIRSADSGVSASELVALQSTKNVTVVAEGTSSASLINACDVLVDVDSSIAFDAVILDKPYVRPKYLQDESVSTIWDELGGAHQTLTQEETMSLLVAPMLSTASRNADFDEVVFGGQGNDVLSRYRDGLAAIYKRV